MLPKKQISLICTPSSSLPSRIIIFSNESDDLTFGEVDLYTPFPTRSLRFFSCELSLLKHGGHFIVANRMSKL